jgi:Helix-turn-helix domain
MFNEQFLTQFIESVAQRVVEKLSNRLPQQSHALDEPLLLTVEQAARKLGRTAPAVEHLIRESKLPVVRIDRRVFIDYRDILSLVAQHKTAL